MNNAGKSLMKAFMDTSIEDLDSFLNMFVRAPFTIMKQAMPSLIENKGRSAWIFTWVLCSDFATNQNPFQTHKLTFPFIHPFHKQTCRHAHFLLRSTKKDGYISVLLLQGVLWMFLQFAPWCLWVNFQFFLLDLFSGFHMFHFCWSWKHFLSCPVPFLFCSTT